ncbi:hypothetical protein [Halomicrococcus sp. NG-SE-24]
MSPFQSGARLPARDAVASCGGGRATNRARSRAATAASACDGDRDGSEG